MSTTGTDEMGPVKVGAPYIDYATGLNAAFAVMAALRQRDLTGEFQLVDVSMLDTAMTMMANNLVTVATTGKDLPKLGNEAASRAPSSGCFATQGGDLLMLAAIINGSSQIFARYWGILNGSKTRAGRNREHVLPIKTPCVSCLNLCFCPSRPKNGKRYWIRPVYPRVACASSVKPSPEVSFKPAGFAPLECWRRCKVPVSLPGIGFRLNRASLTPDRPPRAVGGDDAAWRSD